MSNRMAIFRSFMVLCAIILSAGCTYATGVDQEYTKSFVVKDRPDVHIHVANARVQVITSDDPNVAIRVHYAIDGSDSTPPFASRQDGNVIELRENDSANDWWSWASFGVERATVEVRMPKNADLQLHTSNGAIEVSSLNGAIRLHTSNGAITATALKGKVQAGSSNGSINIDGVDGDCEVSTSNGRIHASGRFDALMVHSSNGQVVARAEAGSTVSSRWNIGTSNSSIELSLPPTLKADLDISTSNGGVQLELPVTVQGYQDQSHLHGALNGGGPEVSVHTSNGHIRVSGVGQTAG